MQKNLLIIEDDFDTLALMREIFEMNDCVVQEASNSEEAIAILSQNVKFDFILTDYNVPGLRKGESILSLIKERTSLAPDKIYLISGDANTREIARSEGVQFLSKPISLKDLTSILH